MIWDKFSKRSHDSTVHSIPKVCLQCGKEYGNDKRTCPADGGLLIVKKPKAAGGAIQVGDLFVDRYNIVSVLGEGGMSLVYQAHHIMMDRKVAIKILKNFESSQDKMLKRFQQEARAASSLSHPNLITIHDFGITTDGHAYLVMDYLEGKSLDTIIEEQGSVSQERATKIFMQICDGLEHAHSKGIVHRDIKPSNILVLKDSNGEDVVKIVDFGIAKLLPEANKETFHLTQAGQIFGSPLFMSPEQCANKKIDNRTDIYALGATLYNTMAGRPPFEAPTLAEIIYSHLKEKPSRIKEVAPGTSISERFEELVLRCLEKDPDDRFQTMAELKAEIEVAGGAKKKNKPPRETLINVVIAEDSDELANRLTENIALSSGVAVTGRARSGEEAIDKVMQFLPQVVLVDVKMPGLDGVQVTKQLKSVSPNLRVLLFTEGDDHNALINMLKAGADGYMFGDLSPNRLGPAIKSIVNGVPWIDPEITSRVLRHSAHQANSMSARLDTSVKKVSNEEMDHVSFLETLAHAYVQEKKYDEAEALYHGAIALHEKSRGKDSAELAPLLTRLADLYLSRQKSAASEQIYLRALEIRFHHLGPEHKDVAASLENLALLFQISGCHAEAERFYLWALRIRSKVADRSDEAMESMASTYQRLSTVYRSLNRVEEADDMETRAKSLREDALSTTRVVDR